MINSWSLLYDELYGDDEMSGETFNVGAGNTASASDDLNINVDFTLCLKGIFYGCTSWRC